MLEIEKSCRHGVFVVRPWSFPLRKVIRFCWHLKPNKANLVIYAQGIQLALDFLQMSFGELLLLLKQVMSRLDGTAQMT